MQKFDSCFFCLFLRVFLRKTEAWANKISADLSSFMGSPWQKLVHSWLLPEQNDGVVLIYSSWACVKMSVKLDLIGKSDINSLRRDDAELIIYEDSASSARFPVFSVWWNWASPAKQSVIKLVFLFQGISVLSKQQSGNTDLTFPKEHTYNFWNFWRNTFSFQRV